MASLLSRQVARARRRLVLGSLLTLVAWLWVAAILLAAAWFFAGPLVAPDAPEWVRWAVLGGLLAAATAAGVALALRRGPSPVVAALTLDDRFGLKERVTTSLTLTDEQAATPAGRMLLADAEARLGQVRVSDRFPVRLPWRPLALVPVGLAGLLLLALFWSPQAEANRQQADDAAPALPPEARASVEQKMKQLAARKPREKANTKADPDAKELEKIEAEIEKFARRPRDTREDVRERIKDATELEAQIKRQQEQQAGRVDALQEQARQMDRLKRKKRDEQQPGPGRDAADAVARADFDRARDELERLSRRLEKEEQKERLRRKARDPKVSDEERKKAEKELDQLNREQNMTQKDREALEKQLKEMEDQLKRLSRDQKEKENEIEQKKKEAEKKQQGAEKKKDDLDKKKKELDEKEKRGEGQKEEIQQQKQELEQKQKQAQQEKAEADREKQELDREQEQLKKSGEQVSKEDLQELKKAADKLGQARDAMKEGKEGEAAKKMQEAGEQMGQMGQEGQQKALAQKLAQVREVRKALARSLDGAAPASGRRPLAKDENTGHEEKSARGEWDKSKVQGVGFGPMGGFKGPRKPSDMKEEIRQGAQEQAAAVDRQRLPASRRNLAKGFFEQMRGEDKDKKKP